MRYDVSQANRLGNRASNQDRLDVIETDEGVLLVLADGMGGLSKGDVAAQMVIDIARDVYQESSRPIRNTETFLRRIIYESHDLLAHRIDENTKKGPGTTAVLCLIQNGQARWAHVGDSRLYIYRNGKPVYRTQDHSYVESLYQQGLITEQERASHPRRHQITQCVGCTPRRPDVSVSEPTQLKEGDVLLLCSDGLWDSVSEKAIGDRIDQGPLDDVLFALADQAERNAYPKSDNISVVGFRLLAHDPNRRKPVKLVNDQQASGENLQFAIDEIERVLHEYEEEMKR